MTAGRKPRRRGALMVLAGLLAASGAIRIGLGVQEARALAPAEPPAPQAAQVCGAPPEALAQALSAREERLQVQEAALADRLAALDLAEQALTAQIAALEEAESRLAATIAQADGAAEADVTRLTAVYETMKPRDAALLFAAMDPDFAAGFLGRMRAEAAAAILAGMEPERAYAISALLAGRNALAPRE